MLFEPNNNKILIVFFMGRFNDAGVRVTRMRTTGGTSKYVTLLIDYAN